MNTFILTRVVANIHRNFPDLACLVLGKAIVWLFFSLANNFISPIDCNQVKSGLVETGIVVEEGKNPISKMPVLLSGNHGMVNIDEIPIGPPIDLANGGDALPMAGGEDN